MHPLDQPLGSCSGGLARQAEVRMRDRLQDCSNPLGSFRMSF
jgi:hypothetical protein